MKNLVKILLNISICLCAFLCFNPVCNFSNASAEPNISTLENIAEPDNLTAPSSPKQESSASLDAQSKNILAENNVKLMAIVIDDFGSFDRSGVAELLASDIAITCAIMPFVDFSYQDYTDAINNNKEVILHMPMQAHVTLPESWYGPVYITNHEEPSSAIAKLKKCLDTMPEAKGFNIHIGSGVSRNKQLMEAIYNYAKENNLFFLDSRTILEDKCEEASQSTNSIYLGRDVFLEADKNKSYAGVCFRLNQAAQIAQEKGYSIAIGHVGAEGGVNTVRAILDSAKKIEESGVKIVPLSTVYNAIKEANFK